MFHGLNNDFLYSALKISVSFQDDIGNIKSGHGTAFFVRNKDNDICLVTNRHILDLTYKCDKEYQQQLVKYRITTIVIAGKRKNSDQTIAPLEDQIFFVIPDQTITYPTNYDNDAASINNVKVLKIGTEAVSDFFIDYKFIAQENDLNTQLSVCDFVAFPGFPEWHDVKENRPIFRTGTISSDPRTNYSYNDIVSGDCIAYEAFSFNGSSGSPVFAMQKGLFGRGIIMQGSRRVMLIGINAGHMSEKKEKLHSGISYMYKSTVIIELIDKKRI